jgi:hypothetical protein
LIVILFVLAFIGLLLYATLKGPRYRVTVCVSFAGHSACKTVSARSESAALRSATENACADLASGVTETMRCQQSEPQSIRWLERPTAE